MYWTFGESSKNKVCLFVGGNLNDKLLRNPIGFSRWVRQMEEIKITKASKEMLMDKIVKFYGGQEDYEKAIEAYEN